MSTASMNRTKNGNNYSRDKRMKFQIYKVTVASLLTLGPIYAQACKALLQAPDDRYEISANGSTVLDRSTNLIWQRCNFGETWNGERCSGRSNLVNWQAALANAELDSTADYTDWRLPNLKELLSLVDYSCAMPTINESVFPSASIGGYWSSTPVPSVHGSAYHIQFTNGQPQSFFDKSAELNVRLVRTP